MKKLFLLMLLCCLMIIPAFAQGQPEKKDLKKNDLQLNQGQAYESQIPNCFCCSDSIYSLPTRLIIEGPRIVDCGTKVSFTVPKCPGASFNWSVSPSISGITGNGTNTITIPATAPAGTYTVTLTLRCGNRIVTSQLTFIIRGVKGCTPAFTITVTQQTNGSLTINAVPAMLIPGQEHWWGIQYNGTYPNCTIPCAAIPFSSFNSAGVWGGYINTSGVLTPYMGTGITTGTTPYGINYSGFPNNCCFKITHYVKCCGVLVRQTQCVSIGTSNLKSANANNIKPNITIGQIETVDIKN